MRAATNVTIASARRANTFFDVEDEEEEEEEGEGMCRPETALWVSGEAVLYDPANAMKGTISTWRWSKRYRGEDQRWGTCYPRGKRVGRLKDATMAGHRRSREVRSYTKARRGTRSAEMFVDAAVTKCRRMLERMSVWGPSLFANSRKITNLVVLFAIENRWVRVESAWDGLRVRGGTYIEEDV